MSNKINKAYCKLAEWYQGENKFLQYFSYFCLSVIAHILFWIYLGKMQIGHLHGLKDEMRTLNRNITFFNYLDILYEFFVHGFLVYEYISYHFEKKSSRERKAFFSEMEKFIFMNICNTREDKWKMRDKRQAYEIFKDWYKREQIIVKSKDDLKIYTDFISKHPKFFIKPFAGGGGVDSGWFDSSKYSSPLESLETITRKGSFVLEEGIYQCNAVAAFNPDSINALRIITIRQGDKVSNWCSFFKTGRKGCPVDNGGKGGILIGVDINTGETNTDGVNELGVVFESHPDSGLKFKGFKLPFWEEACKMSIEMMSALPSIRCIGWDIALTDNGPVVIEANGQTALCGPQITQQKGLKEEYIRILKTLK